MQSLTRLTLPQLTLSEKQQATVAFAVTLVCAVIIITFTGSLFWLAGLFVQRFSGILLPLAVAGVLAMMLKPYHRWLTRRFGGRSWLGVVGVYLSVLIPVVVLGGLFGVKLVNEAADFINNIPKWSDALEQRVQTHLPALEVAWVKYDVTAKIKNTVQEHGTEIFVGVSRFGEIAYQAWGSAFRALAGMLSWVILPVYLGFFIVGEPITKGRFEALFPFLKEETRKDISYLVFEFVDIILSFFRGQLIIAFLQGILFAIGFSLVGLDYGFVIGLSLGFLNVIPYLGSMVGLGVALPMAFFQHEGGPVTFGLVLLVFVIVQCIEGYLLTPRIMGERTGLHPLAIIVAIFFWGSVFGGITGMILAIPLTAFLVVLWRLARTKYITELL
jgi:predicted PurR-regulated permease PerM